MRSKTLASGVVGIVIGVLLSTVVVLAGSSLDPTVGPTGAASQMYTLEQIYTRLTGGGDATKMTAFTEPSSGPGTSTMHTLDEIYALALPARLPKTGQTTCYDTTAYSSSSCPVSGFPGQDGDLQKGVAWPNPRFITGTTGVVTDTLTGLIWLKNANCFGLRNWTMALSDANSLATGNCGLSDGSVAGDWRLPNVRELHSIVHYSVGSPAVPNTAGTAQWAEGDPFIGVLPDIYWSSTTSFGDSRTAWGVNLHIGVVADLHKTLAGGFVWPVRGGQ